MSLDDIYSQLNINPDNGLCVVNDNNCAEILPKRLSFLITEKLKPESFFCFDGKPLILFYDHPKDKTELLKKIWNFNESPIVIINEPDAVEIYNGFSYLKDKKTLKLLAKPDKLTDFSYFELVTGKSLEKYHNEFKKEVRVDNILLNNIKVAREILIKQHGISPAIANALIGKCIFVRYLIDRKVALKYEIEINSNESFCQLLGNKETLIKFLKHLEVKFNGEAFLLGYDKLKSVPNAAFKTLKGLLEGVEISSGQQSLFDIYDFSIIPVEFISNVYEYFIGDQNQAKKGAYYTPKFLVDYILAETFGKHYESTKQYSCKVLDPACGSGIFLVEALRHIIEKYIDSNNRNITNNELRQLAEDNIYGIDKDKDAINVAIFSIYLALLDYQNPKDIEKFTFPKLKQNGNFYESDFFDTNAEYNKKFQKLEFDFIIGNPPWKRGANDKDLFVKYIKNRKGDNSNKEIAQAFLVRTSDFSSKNTKCALIVTSKVLYNLQAEKFRAYFLKNYLINKVFELAPVAKEIFVSANAPAVILFFQYDHTKNIESNLIIHQCLKPNRLFTLFKIFTLQKPDIKTVVQKRFIEYDWLWKVLVYGSYLDFNFLKRLKNDYKAIQNVIDDSSYMYGRGIIVGTNDKRDDMSGYVGKKLINHKKDIKQYCVTCSLTWIEQSVTRKRNSKLFQSPVLLVKHALNKNNMNAISAILYTDALYKDSITGIKGDLDNLKILCGLFNSDFFSYFMANNSIASIDRGRAHDKEKFNFPYIYNPKIAEIVKEINNEILKVPQLENKKNTLIQNLNNEIFKSFDLSEQEKDLVYYAINVTIPRIKKHSEYKNIFSPIAFKDKALNDYIQIYFLRFTGSFGDDKYLKAEIWHTKHILGIFFEVTSENNKLIEWHEQSEDDFLAKISALGIEKITKNLFIQKDIRGFEAEGFYIIKPNEKNLWHKAMAHLDADDFMDAILKTGKKKYNE